MIPVDIQEKASLRAAFTLYGFDDPMAERVRAFKSTLSTDPNSIAETHDKYEKILNSSRIRSAASGSSQRTENTTAVL